MRWAGRIEVHTRLWWGNLREGDCLEDLGMDGRKIIIWIFKKWNGGVDWIDLAGVKGRRRSLMKVLPVFHKVRRVSFLAEDLLALQEGFCSEESVSRSVGMA
jgi:hypothetical protein